MHAERNRSQTENIGQRVRTALGLAHSGGLTRGELAILLLDVDDGLVSDALEAEQNADRVVQGVAGGLVRFYLA